VTTTPTGMPSYRPSRGEGRFHLPSGQDVLMCADDEKIEAEMKRRDLWKLAQENAALGHSFVLTHTTTAGLEVFMWIGNAKDGGFIWYSLPGAKEMPPEVASTIMGAFGHPPPVFGRGFSYGLS